MVWCAIFLLCGVLAGAALLVWLGVITFEGFLTSVERSLQSFSGGHAIVALLYLVPTWLFACALIDGIRLAFSFITTVFLK